MSYPFFAEESKQRDEHHKVIKTRVNSGWQGKKISIKNQHIEESDSLPWERKVTRPLLTPLVPDNSLISVVGNGFPVGKAERKKNKRSRSKDLKKSLKSSETESRKVRKTVRFQSPVEQDPFGIPNLCIKGKTMEASERYHMTNTLPPLKASPSYQNGNRIGHAATGDPCEIINSNERLHFLPDIATDALPVAGKQKGGVQRMASEYFVARKQRKIAESNTTQVAWNCSESAFDRYKKMKKKMYSLY